MEPDHPPLFRGQQLDYSVGTWDDPPPATSESPSIFIGNIERSVPQKLVAELCCQFGPLDTAVGNAVRLLKDQRTGLSKGAAFCDYAHVESARYAIAVLHDFSLAGQRLRVNPAGGGGGGGGAPTARPPAGAFVRPQWDARTDQDAGRNGREERRHHEEEERRSRRHQRRSYSRSRSRSRSRGRHDRDGRWGERDSRRGERDGGRWEREERWDDRRDDERRWGEQRDSSRWGERDGGGRWGRDEREGRWGERDRDRRWAEGAARWGEREERWGGGSAPFGSRY